MPKQIFDAKTFKDILPRAEEVRVARSSGKTKLKLRTKGMLYTYVTDELEAERLLKEVDKPVVDLTREKVEREKEKPKETKEEEQGEEKAKQAQAKTEEGAKETEKRKAAKKSRGKKKKEKAE